MGDPCRSTKASGFIVSSRSVDSNLEKIRCVSHRLSVVSFVRTCGEFGVDCDGHGFGFVSKCLEFLFMFLLYV